MGGTGVNGFDGFDSDPGLDGSLWIKAGRVHRSMGCDTSVRGAVAWSPDVGGENDRACPTCLPDGLPS